MKILKKEGQIIKIQSESGNVYDIDLEKQTCNCMDFLYRANIGKARYGNICKHLNYFNNLPDEEQPDDEKNLLDLEKTFMRFFNDGKSHTIDEIFDGMEEESDLAFEIIDRLKVKRKIMEDRKGNIIVL